MNWAVSISKKVVTDYNIEIFAEGFLRGTSKVIFFCGNLWLMGFPSRFFF